MDEEVVKTCKLPDVGKYLELPNLLVFLRLVIKLKILLLLLNFNSFFFFYQNRLGSDFQKLAFGDLSMDDEVGTKCAKLMRSS